MLESTLRAYSCSPGWSKDQSPFGRCAFLANKIGDDEQPELFKNRLQHLKVHLPLKHGLARATSPKVTGLFKARMLNIANVWFEEVCGPINKVVVIFAAAPPPHLEMPLQA
jgi:hypothetical protein